MRLAYAPGVAVAASLFLQFFATTPARAEYMLTSFYHAPRPEVAAHKTLPKGTWLKLTNPANGNTTTVVIDDRGPFKGNRALDISRARAYTLGFVKKGVTTLLVQRLN